MAPVVREAIRGITDPCAFAIFFIAWGVMLAVASIAFQQGSVARVLHGTDYNGYVCGSSPSSGSFAPPNWNTFDAVWYPIVFDETSGTFDVVEAMKVGICVSECPQQGTEVSTYGGPFAANLPQQFPVLYRSTSRFGRCVPQLSTFSCQTHACYEQRSSAAAATAVLSSIGVGDFFFGLVTQMRQGWAMISTLTIVCVIMCFLWLFVLRKIVKALVLATCVALLALLAAIGCLALHQRNAAFQQGAESGWYTFVAAMSFIAAILFVCAFVYLFQDIMLSCGIVEEAARVVAAAPWLICVPVVHTVAVVLVFLFFVFVSVNIYTSQSQVTVGTTVGTGVNNGTATGAVSSFVDADWQGVGQFYSVFMLLWTVGTIHASTTLIVALVAGQWFWSCPGDDKVVAGDAVRWSVWTTFRYHIGTIVFGSFLIAVVQFSRFLLRLVERRLHSVLQRSDVVSAIVCVAECLLACFERIVRFLTKNAYVMTALLGRPLIPSAREAFRLLLGNVKVLAVDVIADVMIAIGKFAIMAFTVAMGYAWMRNNAAYQETDVASGSNDDSSGSGGSQQPAQNFLIILVVLALVAYFVVSLFATVFHVCVDTILLSYCYDLEHHNGADKPYFSPSSLTAFVDASAAAHAESHNLGKGASREADSLLKK